MNFKKTKEEVISDAYCAADSCLAGNFGSLKYQLMHNSPENNLNQI